MNYESLDSFSTPEGSLVATVEDDWRGLRLDCGNGAPTPGLKTLN